MRMRRSTFDHVLSLLRGHAGIVLQISRGAAQLPLEKQLAIVLYRFDHYRNSSRVEAVGDLFGVSSGTVVKCTHRVIRGLRRIAPSVIRWPNAQQRAEQAKWAGESFGFDKCLGVTDGTTFPWHTSLLCTHGHIMTGKAGTA